MITCTRGKFSLQHNQDSELNFVLSAGNISSPNYPNNYPKSDDSVSENKSWQLEAEVGCRIKLTFEEFDVEDNSNCSCDYDFVKISDTSYDGKLCGSFEKKFCGPDTPVTFTSDGPTMNIYFEWDHFESRPGFIAKWESIIDTDEE